MPKPVLILLIGMFFTWGFTRPALGVLQFQKEFLRLYNIDRKQEKKSDYAKAVLKAKCFVCHQGKKTKKNHNPYGNELKKLLDAKKDKKNPEKIAAAIEKVAELHTDPKDKKSPTYGELIKAGKLPGGPLEEAKKEPKKAESGETEEADKNESTGKP